MQMAMTEHLRRAEEAHAMAEEELRHDEEEERNFAAAVLLLSPSSRTPTT